MGCLYTFFAIQKEGPEATNICSKRHGGRLSNALAVFGILSNRRPKARCNLGPKSGHVFDKPSQHYVGVHVRFWNRKLSPQVWHRLRRPNARLKATGLRVPSILSETSPHQKELHLEAATFCFLSTTNSDRTPQAEARNSSLRLPASSGRASAWDERQT